MAKPRELRRRIKSVENTRQITKTMEMVATSRLKRAQDRVRAARPYAEALTDVIRNLYSPELIDLFPLLRQPKGDPSSVALVLITSNRGLCGAFNGNLIRSAKERLAEFEARGIPVELHGIGRKGVGYFKYIGHALASVREDIGDRPKAHHAAEIMEPLMERFQVGELDAVEVIFAKFNSPLSTPPRLMPILPVSPPAGESGEGKATDTGERSTQRRSVNFMLKPSAQEIVGAILPLYIRNSMYRALAETAASEHGARRTAMKSATDNAGEMLDKLRRTYNRARQAVITQELAEIVGGAEALKG
jgi:F-type H+-transporting ATPase subunit gamma